MSVDPAELLRQQGFKVTAQRLAVLRAVSGRPHLTADDVVEIVRADIGAISRRAVYDAVGVLADMGLLRRIQPAGSAARYEDRVGDNHHHLICRACGQHGRRRLRRRCHAVLDCGRRRGLRHRRGRGHLLGPLPHLSAGSRRHLSSEHSRFEVSHIINRGESNEQRRARHGHHQRRAVHSDMPGDERRAPGRRDHGQPALVARQLEPADPPPEPPAGRSDGRRLRLRRGVQQPRLRRPGQRRRCADDRLAGLVAGRLRPLRTVLHPHDVARRRHVPHRRRPRRRRRAARSASPRSTAGPTTSTSTRPAGCCGRSSRSTAGRSRGPTC